MYNHYYAKSYDKKTLHKIKKQWVIISITLLLCIGGVSINKIAHADNHLQYVTQFNNYKYDDSDPIYNQNYHYNAPHGIFGDMEGIKANINNNKVRSYNIYSMYNPKPLGDGNLEWGQFGTANFSHFYPVNNSNISNNIAIPDIPDKEDIANNNIHGIPWESSTSGSIINNNGKLLHDMWGNPINKNAQLAYFSNNNENIWLMYSNNNQQFQPYDSKPIISGYGSKEDFRDPFIMQNPVHSDEWDAYIAGGTRHRIYVFTSFDGVHWYYDSSNDIYLNGSGVAETPNIRNINNKPILFTSCEPTWPISFGYVYYINGYYDNNGIFKLNPKSHITKLDDGLDNYAPGYTSIDDNTLVGIGKMQDWAYQPKGNTSFVGSFTLPRVIQRNKYNSNILDITPIDPGLSSLVMSKELNNNRLFTKPNVKINVAFHIPVSHFNLTFNRNNNINNKMNFNFNNGILTIHRYDSDLNNSHNNMQRSSNLNINRISSIIFYLDNDSIEAYIPELHKIFTWADYSLIHNSLYTLITDKPIHVNIYKFNLLQSPRLNNINNITSEYSADEAELNKDMSVISGHTNDSVNNSKDLLNSYFSDIQNTINDANTNITQVNNYNGDARQHVFIALANNDMDIANTKLYQASLQLKNLNDIATPYLDASAADARIANYYKTSVANSVARANQQAAQNAAHTADENIIDQQKASVANSVNAANQQKANQAAQQADQRIAQQQRTSVANSVAAANRAKANHAAQIADQNILNQQKQSVANSVNVANQRTATSAANSANKSIESSIANSYAKSVDNSIVNSYRNSASASVSVANSSCAKTAAGKAAAKSGASSADKSIESSIASSFAKSADTNITNSYKNSVDNSVRAANQSKANSAAKSADTSIANSAAQSADWSIENSIANSYTNLADTSIVNSYKNSVNNSVRAANQSKANSAAKSADISIANSAVQSADQSIENSIANSYKNSVDNSVAVANQSKARSAASSADQRIASSEAAKNASQQTSSQSQQPVAPFIPTDNVTPTPTAITSNSVTKNSNNDSVMSSNSSDLNSSVTTSSNVSKNVKRRASKPVMKKLVNNQIPLLGLAKRTYFYQHDEAFVFTNQMKKRTNVLQTTVWPNHHVVYKVRIGKRTGYMYGYLKTLAKPEFFTKRNMYIHVGKRMIKLPMKRFNRIKINRAVRYAGKNYVKYYVNYGRKRGVIYGKLPKITERILTNKANKDTYSKYYQVIPKRYHYVNVKKPLLIYNNKHFTKRDHRGSIRKGITIRVKQLVRDGSMTRFKLMNGRYITGLKNFVKLVK